MRMSVFHWLQVGVTFEVFNSGSRIKNNHRFVRLHPSGLPKFCERNTTSRSLRSNEQALRRTHGSGRRNHLFVANRERGALRGMNCVQNEKISDGFGNPETGCFGRSVEMLSREAYILRKRGDDWVTARSLN